MAPHTGSLVNGSDSGGGNRPGGRGRPVLATVRRISASSTDFLGLSITSMAKATRTAAGAFAGPPCGFDLGQLGQAAGTWSRRGGQLSETGAVDRMPPADHATCVRPSRAGPSISLMKLVRILVAGAAFCLLALHAQEQLGIVRDRDKHRPTNCAVGPEGGPAAPPPEAKQHEYLRQTAGEVSAVLCNSGRGACRSSFTRITSSWHANTRTGPS